MDKKLEVVVLGRMCQAWVAKNRQNLRFHEIVMLTGIKKSTLQRVLNRLANRGWIKKHSDFSTSGIEPNDFQGVFQYNLYRNVKTGEIIGRVEKIYDRFRNELGSSVKVKTGEPSYEEKRRVFRRVKSDFVGREYTFYTLQFFPYLLGGGKNTPEGSRRIWKSAAKQFKVWKVEYGRDHQIHPIIIATPTKTKIIKEGHRKKETKLKILEIKDGKYRLQDPQTKEVIEVNESELIQIPTRH